MVNHFLQNIQLLDFEVQYYLTFHSLFHILLKFYFRFLVYKRSMPQNGIAALAAAALLPLRSSSAAASLAYTSRCFGQRLCEQYVNLRDLLLRQVPKSPISCAVLFLSHCRPPGFCLCISIIPRLIWLFFLSYFSARLHRFKRE